MSEMMIDEDEFDLVVIGTGLVNALVGAAASIAGKTVLQVDPAPRYAASWASYSLNEICEMQNADKNNEKVKEIVDWRQLVEKQIPDFSFQEVSYTSLESDSFQHFSNFSTVWSNDIKSNSKLKELNRKFILELNSHTMFSSGPLVELLIRSRNTEYCQFAAVDHIYSLVDGDIQRVPISKSDIFQSQLLSLQDKRQLMKFVHGILGEDGDKFATLPSNAHKESKEPRSMLEYVQNSNLPLNLHDMILYGIGASVYNQTSETTDCDTTDSKDNSLEVFKLTVLSSKRFGQGCFLYPLYGLSTLSEMMCRKSAVFGGLYLLSFMPLGVISDRAAEKTKGIVCPSGQFIQCSELLIDQDLCPGEYEISEWSRCIVISSSSIIPQHSIEDTLRKSCVFTIPPNAWELNNQHPIRIVQLDSSTRTCPQGYFVVYISTPLLESPGKDLTKVVSTLCPNAVMTTFYQETIRSKPKETLPFLTRSQEQYPDHTLVAAVKHAESIFCKLYPEESFFPQPPEPTQLEDSREDPDEDAFGELSD